jgi:hypothetical protein
MRSHGWQRKPQIETRRIVGLKFSPVEKVQRDDCQASNFCTSSFVDTIAGSNRRLDFGAIICFARMRMNTAFVKSMPQGDFARVMAWF